MTKYIIVSGGVISGIGKGVIGALRLSFCILVLSNKFYMSFHHHVPPTKKNASKTRIFAMSSFVNGPSPKNNGPKSHVDKDRPIYEHRRGNDEAYGAWWVAV